MLDITFPIHVSVGPALGMHWLLWLMSRFRHCWWTIKLVIPKYWHPSSSELYKLAFCLILYLHTVLPPTSACVSLNCLTCFPIFLVLSLTNKLNSCMEIKKKGREARFIFRLNKVWILHCKLQSKIQLCKCLCIVLYSITFNSDSNYL